MRKQVFGGLGLGLVWFLILPFPFEIDGCQYTVVCVDTISQTHWAWLGGYHLVTTALYLGGGYIGREMSQPLYHYAHRWYILLFWAAALALGYLTVVLVTLVVRRYGRK